MEGKSNRYEKDLIEKENEYKNENKINQTENNVIIKDYIISYQSR